MPDHPADLNGRFDVIVIGSGISGTILGAILARHGQKVLILESSRHPRFAIGESLILEASEAFRMLAEAFSVPEIAFYSAENCFPLIGSSHGVKRHFGFLYHRPHEKHDPKEVLQVVIPEFPYSHELHIYRQDCDYFYLSVAIRYGATVVQNARIESVDIDSDAVRIATNRRNYRSSYVVDASGYRSVLAEKYNLRDFNLKTHSRSLFTHMVGVPGFHEVGPPLRSYDVPFPWSEGSLHHIFEGGWFWVIPFNNHPGSTNQLCSVGLTLDSRIHPKPDNMTAEEEFRAFTSKYPDIGVQLARGKPVRDWVHTERINYSSKRVIGERFCLLGHTAGFIDPLFSKGLYMTLSCLVVVAKQLLVAKKSGDYSLETFKPVEEVTQRFIKANDVLISSAYKSWCDQRLWHKYAATWLLGAYLELVKITIARLKLQRMQSKNGFEIESVGDEIHPGTLSGGGYPEYWDLAHKIHAIVEGTDTKDKADIERSIQAMMQLYDEAQWIPHQYRQIVCGKTHLPRRKFTHRIFLRSGGLLGKPSFRAHFFEDLKASDIALFLIKERVAYSRWNLARRNRPALVDGGG